MLFWLMRSAQWLAGHMPRRLRLLLGGLIAQVVYWSWPSKRLATQKNMSVILGLPARHPQVRRAARHSWRNYGRYIGDFFDLPNHPAQYYLDQVTDVTGALPDATGRLPVYLRLDEARAQGKGVIITTGHFGNWDIAGVLVAAHAPPLYVIAEEFTDARLNARVQEQRRAVGMTILYAADLLRPLLRLLKQGELVATPVDRPLTPSEGVPVRFFGRTAYVPRALGALAVKLGAVILPGFVWYDAAMRYQAKAFPPRVVARSGDEQADIIAATQIMYDALEAVIREDPTQWYMFRQFWPDHDDPPPPPTPRASQTMVEAGASTHE